MIVLYIWMLEKTRRVGVTMGKCNLCAEKEKRIHAILKGYKADKLIYRKIILALAIMNVLTLAFGKEGIQMLFDAVKEWLI